MNTGYFIVLEGTDGSGLSTQTARLADWFRASHRDVYATKEPTTGPAGATLRLALTHRIGTGVDGLFQPLNEETMALLYAADRMDHLASDIEPRLDRGTTVVCDRYVLSSYAFQRIGTDLDWLRSLNSHARVPDLTVFIDVPPEISVERMRSRGTVERYEKLETLARVRANYHHIIPLLQADGHRIVSVDGTLALTEVQQAITSAVQKVLSL